MSDDVSHISPEAAELAAALKTQWAGIGRFGPALGKTIVDDLGYRRTANPKPGQPNEDDTPSDLAKTLAAQLTAAEPAWQMMGPLIALVAVDYQGFRPAR